MLLSWPNRFFLLLPCTLTLLFLFSFRTHDETTGIPIPSFSASNGTLPKILLVSAFFPFSKSKHTMGEYEYWLERFLRSIIHGHLLLRTARHGGAGSQMSRQSPYNGRHDLRVPFPHFLHSAANATATRRCMPKTARRFGILRNSMLSGTPSRSSSTTPCRVFSPLNKTYDYAFWNDAGSFRSTHKYAHWPDPARVEQLWQEGSVLTGQKAEDLLLFPITGLPHPSMRYWTQDHGPVDNEVSEGSFFGGSPSTVAWWRRTFYAYHDHYLRLGLFVGKDQTLINALFLLFPSRIIAVWLGDPDAPAHVGLLPVVDQGALGSCGAEWFYYQFWLATPAEQSEMHDLWESDARWSWDWWRQRQKVSCNSCFGYDGPSATSFWA
ncbi:hypothetical protein C8F01DRAFT_442039 [Mycena amicta]|nr:hypothetical protein C8F01DRAFT_442039 [Mycena amicta]